MWQTKYASVVHKNLGVGVSFRPCRLFPLWASIVRGPTRAWHSLISEGNIAQYCGEYHDKQFVSLRNSLATFFDNLVLAI